MLTLSNRCIYVALCIDAQLVASIRQKAESAVPSSTFGGKQAQTEQWQ
jgi:hypothetical protein